MARRDQGGDPLTRERVSEWLIDEGWKIQGAESPDAEWVFVAEDRQGKKVAFGRNRGRPGFLELQSNIVLDERHRAQLEDLAEDDLEEFLWDLRFELLRLDVEFHGLRSPLRAVGLKIRIYEEDLSRGQFYHQLRRMNRAMLMVLWSVTRKLSHPAPPDAPDGLSIN